VTLEVAPYGPALRAIAERWLSSRGLLDPKNPYAAFWQGMLAGTQSGVEAFVVARDGANALGLAMAFWRPFVDGTARMAMLLLPEDGDLAVPVGPALCAGLVRALEQHGATRLLLFVDEQDAPLQEVAHAAGFSSLGPFFRMGWQSEGTPVPETAVDGVTVSIHRGGDAGVAADIAEVTNRAFARDAIVADLTASDVERLALDDGAWFVVARETATRACVGAAEAAATGFFSSIAVARRYWGTGLADLFFAAVMNEYVRGGVTALHSLVAVKNRPSVALHERMGWKPVGRTEGYLGGAPGDR